MISHVILKSQMYANKNGTLYNLYFYYILIMLVDNLLG